MVGIKQYTEADKENWDTYVNNHPDSNLYHLSGWKRIIEKTYGHRTYYLIAESGELKEQGVGSSSQKAEDRGQRTEGRQSKIIEEDSDNKILSGFHPDRNAKSIPGESVASPTKPKYSTNPINPNNTTNSICGILPFVRLKHFLFGNNLISMPYFDMGGILADDEETERALLNEAVNIGRRLKVETIELRHTKPLNWLVDLNPTYPTNPINPITPINPINSSNTINCQTHSHKVRMLLDLPNSSEILMKSFKSKLRSQIKKPIKEGLTAKVGGVELLDDFYTVFTINMRDLGSPVHSKKLMKSVLEEFSEDSRLVVIYKNDEPVACSLVVKFGKILENPWASAIRQYSRLSPNMLLYWTMLEYACESGCKTFDFGRSSPDEGTYKFKKQWGAEPKQLNWQYVYLKGNPGGELSTDKSKFKKAIDYWQRLPVPVTKIVGPRIRKHIGL